MVTDTNTDKPTAFNDDLPTVQIPLGADRAGLTIDGDFMSLLELPPDAREAYTKYAEQGGNIRLYQCQDCGYLTDADALSTTSRRSYECGGCGRRTASRGLQRKGRADFERVHGPHLDPDDDRYVDVLAFHAEQQCDDGGCDQCVPNHPSHLGRLQNEVEGALSQSEMLHQVAVAVKEFREA